MTRFVIRIALLEALQKFCMDRDAPNQALTCIRITPTELFATNGHRLVSVPVKAPPCDNGDKCTVGPRLVGTVDEPFLLPGVLVEHHAAAARALWNDVDEDEFGTPYPTDFTAAECEVSVVDGRAFIAYDGITLSAPLGDISKYPDTTTLDGTMHREGVPCVARFNPALFDGVAELLHASEDQDGLDLYAWDVFSTGAGPTEWRSYHDTRVVIMGMARTGADLERARKLHEAAMRGERPA